MKRRPSATYLSIMAKPMMTKAEPKPTPATAAAAGANGKSADESVCTRLYVQNLPAYVDSGRLREHFATKGDVTDACVIRTKDGLKSRRFGFVGYKSHDQAKQALAFFHQSFLDTCKLNVCFAVARESDEIARPWSKYSVGSSRFTGSEATAKTEEDAAVATKPDEGSKKKGKSTVAEAEKSEEFQEFMETMQARSKTRFWANDDVQGPEAIAKVQATAPKGMEDGDSDGEYEELASAKDVESKPKKALSDLDFLRSKMTKRLDDGDEDMEGGEKQYAEDIEDDSDVEDDSMDKSKSSKKKPAAAAGSAALAAPEVEEEDNKPTARLFVRNLPFTAEEEDLTDLFSAHGTVMEVHMPLDDTKRRKGYGFVLFKTTVDAQNALNALNGFAFQGRLLHVIYARIKPVKQDPAAQLEDPNLTYKQKKELERQIHASKQEGWNASYIRGDATVGSLATRMGVKRGDIMDKENGNLAVRLAIGETMLIKENKDFFAQEGVDLNAIEGALTKPAAGSAQKLKVERSTTVILIKNLPHTAEEEELAQMFRKFGEIGRFLLPPSKTLAVVEFFEPSEARRAFRSLAYKKYQHVPLYLEWAPVKVFTGPKSSSTSEEKKGIKSTAVVPEANEDEERNADANNTICVKNLNFSTKEASLEKLFQTCGTLRKVTVARRKDPKRGMLSMGFGFVEFVDSKSTEKALETLQSTILDGHALNLKLSQKKMAQAPKRKGETESRSKIIVRNVAFEATSNEIRELFGAFGQLKRVRMPKKFDGKHRGFAFVEFLTEQEAQNAFAALNSSHLYGRHLVLEWAEDADDIDTLRAKATRDLTAINGAFSLLCLVLDEPAVLANPLSIASLCQQTATDGSA